MKAAVVSRFKALKPEQRVVLLAALPVLFVIVGLSFLAGRSGQQVQAQALAPLLPSSSVVSVSPGYDPYAYYQAHNPRPDVVLDRDGALTRAVLGCQYSEAQINTSPIDKVLREAYGPLGICK